MRRRAPNTNLPGIFLENAFPDGLPSEALAKDGFTQWTTSEPILPLVNKNINSTITPMKEIVQEHPFGCAVACTASTLNTSYQKALTLFQEGRRKAEKSGFLCQEITEALIKKGKPYTYKHIGEMEFPRDTEIFERVGTIVFLGKSDKYPHGHFLVRERYGWWMDPWINYPNENRRAGTRRDLPEEPEYVIYPVNP